MFPNPKSKLQSHQSKVAAVHLPALKCSISVIWLVGFANSIQINVLAADQIAPLPIFHTNNARKCLKNRLNMQYKSLHCRCWGDQTSKNNEKEVYKKEHSFHLEFKSKRIKWKSNQFQKENAAHHPNIIPNKFCAEIKGKGAFTSIEKSETKWGIS